MKGTLRKYIPRSKYRTLIRRCVPLESVLETCTNGKRHVEWAVFPFSILGFLTCLTCQKLTLFQICFFFGILKFIHYRLTNCQLSRKLAILLGGFWRGQNRISLHCTSQLEGYYPVLGLCGSHLRCGGSSVNREGCRGWFLRVPYQKKCSYSH